MQLTIERDVLSAALAKAVGVVETRTTIPVLANVLLRAGEGLRITASDLDMEIDLGCAANVIAAGSSTVPADVLHRLARKFPEGAEIGLTLLADKGRMRVACGRSHYDLPVLPAEDFPSLSIPDTGGGMPIAADQLKKLLMRVRFAMSTEETRFYLQGVFLHREDERLVAVATDGHVLAREALPLPAQAGDMPGVILPRKFVTEALRLLPDDGGQEVDLSVSASRVALFFADGTRLVSRLIDGTYPDYKRVIPARHPHLAELPRAATIAAVERAAVMLESKGSKALRLVFGPGALRIMSYTDTKGFASETLDIALDGGARGVEIGVNAGFLLDVLARFGGDTATLRFGDPSAAMLITDGADEGPALAVIMPMRVNAMPAELMDAA